MVRNGRELTCICPLTFIITRRFRCVRRRDNCYHNNVTIANGSSTVLSWTEVDVNCTCINGDLRCKEVIADQETSCLLLDGRRIAPGKSAITSKFDILLTCKCPEPEANTRVNSAHCKILKVDREMKNQKCQMPDGQVFLPGEKFEYHMRSTPVTCTCPEYLTMEDGRRQLILKCVKRERRRVQMLQKR
ncbi:hypothetical protein CAPTEDRAFT_222502, partial [Capitella teleta]